jgi:hypothetical protein
MSRTPQEIMGHHGEALRAENFDEIVMQTLNATFKPKG